MGRSHCAQRTSGGGVVVSGKEEVVEVVATEMAVVVGSVSWEMARTSGWV